MAPDCGLKGFLKNINGTFERVFVNLEKTSAEVVVRGFVAHMSICLAYKNQTKDVFEVTYTCPVDARAAIYSFEAKLDGRTIVARCLEKKKAEETYKKAVEEGRSAIIGERDENVSDLFHLSLGNLPPGESAELILKMVMELPVGVDGSVCFTLPSVFNPRYCPADQPSGPSSPFTASSGNVFPSQSKYTIDVKAEVKGSLKIARIVSQSDPINVTLSDEETNAEVTQDGGFNCNHDWSFHIYYQTPHKAVALQEYGDRSSKALFKDDLVMLNFFPELPLEAYSPHNELIFLVDRSGSMQGPRIAKAKTTLLLFLKSLPPGCRFNIISFGSSYSSLFETGSERYTERTLATAVELQKSMDADMGGTEIFEALKFIYSKDLTAGYARQLIMLTDGEVWNLDQIFELISRHANETRVFAVGIGDGASTAFVQGVAEAGRGRHEMVAHEEQLHTKVMGLVSSMLQESVLDLEVKCDTEPPQIVTLIPKVPPVIFGGQHLILYARLTPKTVVKSIKISGKIGDRYIVCNIAEEDCKVVHDSNLCLHRLAAKAQLKQWEIESTEGVKEEMTDLSIASGVVCRHTALVGLDQDRQIINLGKQLVRDGISHPLFGAKDNSGMLWRTSCIKGGGPPPCPALSNMQFSTRANMGMRQASSNISFGSAVPAPCPPPPVSKASKISGSPQFFQRADTSSRKFHGSLFGAQQSDGAAISMQQSEAAYKNKMAVEALMSTNQFPLAPPAVANQFSFGAPAATNQFSFGAPAVANQIPLAPPAVANQFSFGAPVVANQLPLAPSAVANQFSFGASAVANQFSFGAPTATNQLSFGAQESANQMVFQATGITNQIPFGSATFSSGSQFNMQSTDVPKDELMDLVSSQNFDGSWTMENCVRIINVSKEEIASIHIKQEVSEECLATALCLALLELRYSARKSEWHLLAIKGRLFLDSKGIDSSAVIDNCVTHIKNIFKILS